MLMAERTASQYEDSDYDPNEDLSEDEVGGYAQSFEELVEVCTSAHS